ncbi:MAG: DKNYY domain-containing protein [Nanoarchaeales archaeon]|nr:DKNYY domain-containing protein [Nanoarchaeales archaeon]
MKNITDPESYQFLSKDYGKDKFNVYYNYNILTGADVETFKYNNFITDKNYYYNHKGKVDVEQTNFRYNKSLKKDFILE